MKKVGRLFMLVLFVGLFLTPISAKAAYEENGFVYTVRNKKAIVRGVKAPQNGEAQGEAEPVTELVIPEKLGGFTVTEISSNAFKRAEYVKVVLPKGITKIGYAAFARATKLESIVLPDKLKTVGESAFYNCTSLAAVRFNGKLQEIGDGAFANCVSLKKITFPATLESVGSNAFENCYKLKTVQLNKKLTEIGSSAFAKNYALTSIQIPSGVVTVGAGAFRKCSDLGSVSFNNKKTKLKEGVFKGCTSLKKAVLPSGIKSIPESTFEDCKKMSKVILPKGISIVKKKAFYNCKALKKITFNSKLYAIGDKSFAKSGLQSVNMNQNMQFIGNGAFSQTKLRSLDLKSKVVFIGNKVFADCGKLKRISIPASVKGINPGAFNNCTSLQEINVASGNRDYCSVAGVLYTKDKSKLIQYPLHKTNASFSTPGRVERIRARAFAGNPYLKNVTISAGTIGESAFCDMDSLQSVTIASGTTKIEYSAFAENPSLKKVTLPDSVTDIGGYAFANSAIQTIHIPTKLVNLGSEAFSGCNKISAFLGGRGRYYSVSNGVLYNGSMTTLIQYPSKKADKSFTVPDSVTKVKGQAFYKNKKLTKIYFGKRFRTLGYNAISEAANLKSLVFSSKLSYGSASGVEDCDKLAVIVGPDTYVMRSIAERAGATLISL